jgi:hypothetical protein
MAKVQNRTSESYYVPAVLDHVISVGATNSRDDYCHPDFTNQAWLNCGWGDLGSGYGPLLDVMAPGSADIYTLKRGGGVVENFGGTSASAPFVSGLAALILSVNPNLTPDEVETAIEQNALPLGNNRPDENFGWGRIDAYASVQAVANPPTIPSIRVLLKAVLETPGSTDHSSPVAVAVFQNGDAHRRIWGPKIFQTNSSGDSPSIALNGLPTDTYTICAKPAHHLGVCRANVALVLGQNAALDLSNGGTTGAWPGDIDTAGEDNVVNALDHGVMLGDR